MPSSKVLDFCDTIFMVLRKKWRQITFLHLFHHVSIFLIYWLNAAAAYNGDVYPTIIANSLVHFVMYGYYLLVALYPGYTPWCARGHAGPGARDRASACALARWVGAVRRWCRWGGSAAPSV
jgi:hypothetical protein